MQATLKKIEYTFSDGILIATIELNVQSVGADVNLTFTSGQVGDKANELGQTTWDLSTIVALCSSELGLPIIAIT